MEHLAEIADAVGKKPAQYMERRSGVDTDKTLVQSDQQIRPGGGKGGESMLPFLCV